MTLRLWKKTASMRMGGGLNPPTPLVVEGVKWPTPCKGGGIVDGECTGDYVHVEGVNVQMPVSTVPLKCADLIAYWFAQRIGQFDWNCSKHLTRCSIASSLRNTTVFIMKRHWRCVRPLLGHLIKKTLKIKCLVHSVQWQIKKCSL